MSRKAESDTGPVREALGEYATVSLGSIWGIVSLGLFAASMSARQLVSLLPGRLQGHYMMPPLSIRLVIVFCLGGVLVGIVGLRREKRRSLSLLGVALNAIVLVLATAFMIGFWWVRLR